jgi:hypothetical protein
LRFLNKYRHFVSALLLVLYGFVATPVVYWHHHHNCKTATKQPGPKQIQGTVLDNIANADTDCPICHHEYAVSEAGAKQITIPPCDAPKAHNGHHHTALAHAFAMPLPNKGPPMA